MDRDIQLSSNTDNEFDISVTDGDFALGNSLVNRVFISLFTWAAPKNDDVIPDGLRAGGYWGDGVESSPDDVPTTMGSRLWLLDDKLTDDTEKQAVAYATEALAWLNGEDGVSGFSVSAERRGTSQLDLMVEITMTTGEVVRQLYADILNWGK